jgi:hypothetical protein
MNDPREPAGTRQPVLTLSRSIAPRARWQPVQRTGSSTSMPPIHGTSAVGTTTEPSACW